MHHPAEAVVHQLAALVSRDVGGRGSAHLVRAGDMWRAALALALPSTRKVMITTGFPCCVTESPPTETDGIGGSVAIARSLDAVGKRVTFVVDASSHGVLNASVERGKASSYLSDSPVVLYPHASLDSPTACAAYLSENRWDHLVAIERAGRAMDGSFYTMRAIDMSPLVSPIDDLFLAAAAAGTASTGIGDGGNELGMGRVDRALIEEHIPLGATIGCVTPTSHLIAAGVSDWGGYALAAAIVLATEHHESLDGGRRSVDTAAARARRAAALPTVEGQRAVLRAAVDSGARDGTTGEREMSVDGFTFDAEHAAVIAEVASLTQSCEFV